MEEDLELRALKRLRKVFEKKDKYIKSMIKQCINTNVNTCVSGWAYCEMENKDGIATIDEHIEERRKVLATIKKG